MKEIYPERESKSLEFKSKLPSFHTLIKTCVAFANGSGGKIVVGIEDESRQIIGINEEIRHRIYDELPNSLYDATSPSLLVEIYEKRVGDQNIIIIEVPHSIKKPVFIKSEGIPAGVYLRAGSNTRRANQEYVEELMRENKRMHYDEEPIHAPAEILSADQLRKVFKKTDAERLLTEKVITRSETQAKKQYPTLAGILTFCEHPEQYIPEALIRCTRFLGVEGRDIIQSEEIIGNLETQIETSVQLVKSWIMRDYTLQGVKLRAKTLIPESALREAVVNAVIHRKYTIAGATKIALYDNRLEIFSPGNFPGLFNLTHLGDGTTVLRNPNLARLARKSGIIEQLGTGIKLIFDSCENAGIKKPEFIEGADSVKVIFSFLPAAESGISDEEKLLALFKLYPEVRLNDVESTLNISRNTATRRLNQLMKLGKIRRIGKGPSVRYRLS